MQIKKRTISTDNPLILFGHDKAPFREPTD